MRVRRRFTTHRAVAGIALVASLQLAPAVAMAALASHDLAGTPRAVPTTMGALEARIGLAAPRGLSLTVERL